jgi:hypothetical protein
MAIAIALLPKARQNVEMASLFDSGNTHTTRRTYAEIRNIS